MLHSKASRLALAAAVAVAVAAQATDRHHRTVHIVGETQQQAGPAAGGLLAALLPAAVAAAVRQVCVWRGRLLGPHRRLLQVARQQLVRLAGQRVHQAEQRLPLTLLPLPGRHCISLASRPSCRCACVGSKHKCVEAAGGLGAHSAHAVGASLAVQVGVLLLRQRACRTAAVRQGQARGGQEWGALLSCRPACQQAQAASIAGWSHRALLPRFPQPAAGPAALPASPTGSSEV